MGRRAINVEPEPDVGHVLDPLQPWQPTVKLLPKKDRLVVGIGNVCVRGDGDDDPTVRLCEGTRIIERSLYEIRGQMLQGLKNVDNIEIAIEGEFRIRDVIVPEGDVFDAEFFRFLHRPIQVGLIRVGGVEFHLWILPRGGEDESSVSCADVQHLSTTDEVQCAL